MSDQMNDAPELLEGEEGTKAADAGFAEEAVSQEDKELAEHNALARVFESVRVSSREGRLSAPDGWAEAGVVPDHMTDEDLEMLVYEYWEEHQARQTADERAADEARAAERAREAREGSPTSHVRTATCAVGVPPFLRVRAEADSLEEADAEGDSAAAVGVPASRGIEGSEAEGVVGEGVAGEGRRDEGPARVRRDEGAEEDGAELSEDELISGLKLPEGYTLAQLEGEWVLVPTDEVPEPERLEVKTDHIAALVGARSYYLYDRSLMTDAFARWAFLAAEDDPVVTFAECVREDSRVYPRPLSLESLGNEPFKMTADQVEQAYLNARSAGGYEDIERVEASNGDVYFFSAEHLSRDLAFSLAEWDAVERRKSV